MIVTKNTPINSLKDGEPILINKEVSLDKKFLEFLFVNFPNSKITISTYNNFYSASIPDALYTEEELAVLVQNADMADKYNRELNFDDGYTLEQAIIASRKLNSHADYINNFKIRNIPLSPLEKLAVAYKIVSNNVYADDPNSDQNPRNIISTLSGDKIVCAGFASELNALCKRIGIPCIYRITTFGEKGSMGNHAVCTVNIKDEKYGVDGIYVLDPTGDSNPQKNYSNIDFNYFLLTQKEYDLMKPNNQFDSFTNIIGQEEHNIHSPVFNIENLYPASDKTKQPEFEFFSKDTYSLDYEKIKDAVKENIAKTFPTDLKPASRELNEESKSSIISIADSLIRYHLEHIISGGKKDELPPLVSSYHSFLNTYLNPEEVFDTLFLSVDNIPEESITNLYLQYLEFVEKGFSNVGLHQKFREDSEKAKPMQYGTLSKLFKKTLAVITGLDSDEREKLARQIAKNRDRFMFNCRLENPSIIEKS